MDQSGQRLPEGYSFLVTGSLEYSPGGGVLGAEYVTGTVYQWNGVERDIDNISVTVGLSPLTGGAAVGFHLVKGEATDLKGWAAQLELSNYIGAIIAAPPGSTVYGVVGLNCGFAFEFGYSTLTGDVRRYGVNITTSGLHRDAFEILKGITNKNVNLTEIDYTAGTFSERGGSVLTDFKIHGNDNLICREYFNEYGQTRNVFKREIYTGGVLFAREEIIDNDVTITEFSRYGSSASATFRKDLLEELRGQTDYNSMWRTYGFDADTGFRVVDRCHKGVDYECEAE